MRRKYHWGILGTGRIARSFATALQGLEEAELVAVGSRAADSARTFADELGIPHACESYAELVNRQDLDVIYIATPHALHQDNMRLCLEAGKAVLCEKPFTINAAEARKVIELARRKKLFLMEAMWTRYLPAIIRLRELLAEGVIGNVQVMLAGGAFMPDYDADFYLFNKALGGGVLLDAGVYLVSLASMLFGKPRAIKAIAGIGRSGVDEHDAWLLEHENGALASHYVSLRGQYSPDLTLLGSKGRIYLHPPVFCPSKLRLCLYGEAEQEFDLPFEANGYQYQAVEVMRCLREGRTESDCMPLDESLEIMQTMDAIRAEIQLRYPME